MTPLRFLSVSSLSILVAASAACSSGGPNGYFGAQGGSPDASTPPGDGGTQAPADPCARYLACVLVTSPEAYGAALQVYGEGTDCWKTPQQANGCRQACDAAFEKISELCSCTGAECIKCDDVPATYSSNESSGEMTCDTGETISAGSVYLYLTRGEARAVTAELRVGGMDSPELEGTVPCTGPFTLTGTQELVSGVSETWTVDVTRSNGGKKAMVSVKRKVDSIYGNRNCSVSAELE